VNESEYATHYALVTAFLAVRAEIRAAVQAQYPLLCRAYPPREKSQPLPWKLAAPLPLKARSLYRWRRWLLQAKPRQQLDLPKHPYSRPRKLRGDK
jgi:hypothetical protein